MRGGCAKCDTTTPPSDSANSSADLLQTQTRFCRSGENKPDVKEASPNTREGDENGTTSMTSCWNGVLNRAAEADLQCRVCCEKLQQVTAERDQLEATVRAMEEQRLLGMRKIRELIDENKGLQAAVGQTEVRLSIAEIEQRSMLIEAQHLRERLAESIQELEAERQKKRSVRLTSSNGKLSESTPEDSFNVCRTPLRDFDAAKQLFVSVPRDAVGHPVQGRALPMGTETAVKRWLSPCDGGVVHIDARENHPNALLVANRELEVRCCILENQVRHLFEMLQSHGHCTSAILKDDDKELAL